MSEPDWQRAYLALAHKLRSEAAWLTAFAAGLSDQSPEAAQRLRSHIHQDIYGVNAEIEATEKLYHLRGEP